MGGSGHHPDPCPDTRWTGARPASREACDLRGHLSGHPPPDAGGRVRTGVASQESEVCVRTAVVTRLDAAGQRREGLVPGDRPPPVADGIAVAGVDLDRRRPDADPELQDPVRLGRAGLLALAALGLAPLLVSDPAQGHAELLLLEAPEEVEHFQPRGLFGHVFESSGLGAQPVLRCPPLAPWPV